MPAPESARKRFLETEGLPIIAVLLGLVIVFMIAAPDVFLGYRIYMSFLATVPPLLVLAAALTLLIAAGEIDLSFPSVIALSGWVLAYFTHILGSPWVGLLLALVAGALLFARRRRPVLALAAPRRPYRAVPGAGALVARGRGGALAGAQPTPVRRAPALHRRQCPGRRSGRRQRAAREDQGLHAHGRDRKST